jgi:hypothetical protein
MINKNLFSKYFIYNVDNLEMYFLVLLKFLTYLHCLNKLKFNENSLFLKIDKTTNQMYG